MMGAPSTIGLMIGTAGKPWRRRSDRRWTRVQRRWPTEMLLASIPSLPRASLARLTGRLIDRIDEIDGDSDVEADGNELDGTGGEDDFIERYNDNLAGVWGGPGCSVSDPDMGQDDLGEETNEYGEPEISDLLPEYRDDQDGDPINRADANRSAQLCQGWRWGISRAELRRWR